MATRYPFGDCWSNNTSRGGRAGGLSLWWVEEVAAMVIYASLRCIDAKIVDDREFVWRFTSLYGWLEVGRKKNTWDFMRDLASQWEGPWLCGGDFNEILAVEEKSGGQNMEERDIAEFHDCLLGTKMEAGRGTSKFKRQ
ncbi:unnamed protein product [Linum trigynum]|uniref:Non-LTR retroelement reverse transcriptase n=1 Tax=Linum trigynum TaxID=586398 RepID=A0AAV2CCJ9_9ROSI